MSWPFLNDHGKWCDGWVSRSETAFMSEVEKERGKTNLTRVARETG